jgi:preprotein translocase subunit SecG
MGYFLMAVILVVCFLLGAVILVQNPKGGGLATGFQGASQFGGVQKTSDFLVKATWTLTGALFVLCIAAGVFFGNMNEDVGIDESMLPTTAVPAAAAPLAE